MKKRNTKQKQIILETLRNDRTHPTIMEVYQKVSKKYPSIGQATIYRNVNELAAANEIEKVVDFDAHIHYDGNPKKHLHLLCKNCKNIFDIFLDVEKDLISKISKDNQVLIENISITCEGLCPNCKKLLSKNDEGEK